MAVLEIERINGLLKNKISNIVNFKTIDVGTNPKEARAFWVMTSSLSIDYTGYLCSKPAQAKH